MNWNSNQYHPIHVLGRETLRLAGVLLESYPLTQACLEILGNILLNQLQFGFFDSEIEIIKQGETGKDLFLLCDNLVDVYVDNQKVVQMEAPILIGDKAIVETNSVRSATIKVPPKTTCLVIKIPMGLFIRNFSNRDIKDISFKQDVAIYSNLFQSIQKRLFDFIYLQKNLWEKVNTSLQLINVQALAKFIDNKKTVKMDGKSWEPTIAFLASEHKFQWPKNIPVDMRSLRDILNQILSNRFPQETFKGSEKEYIIKKSLIWRDWLTKLSTTIIPYLSKDQLPINIGEIELFNPKNYQLKVLGLLKSVQKKLGQKGTNINNPKEYFGKGEQSNVFELVQYLQGFEDQYALRTPQRTKAQITQKVAQISATCENEFNTSIVKMQKFLSKAQLMAGNLNQEKKDKTQVYKEVKKYVNSLIRSFTAHNRQFENISQKPIGEVIYSDGITPNIIKLIKSSAINQNRLLIDKAFRGIISSLEIATTTFSDEKIRHELYLCEGSPGYVIPHREVEKNYWIPVSTGMVLKRGKDTIIELEPGVVFGGKGWREKLDDNILEGHWTVQFAKREEYDSMELIYLALVLPASRLQWNQEKTISAVEIKNQFLRMMQWLIDKQLDHMQRYIKLRNTYYNQWVETEEVIKLENKMTEFETTKIDLNSEQTLSVKVLLKKLLGMLLQEETMSTSDILAKQIYNHILMQNKRNFPHLSMVERSNKTYTKWRYVLSEIVNALPNKNEFFVGRETTRPVLEIIESEVLSLISSHMSDGAKPGVIFKEEKIKISLENILTGMYPSGVDIHGIFIKIIHLVEKNLGHILEEMYLYKIKKEKAGTHKPQVDVEAFQLTSILDTIDQLKRAFIDSDSAVKQRVVSNKSEKVDF